MVEGIRGVVVAKALAKIMCRLVPNQNARDVLEAMQQHVASHAPPHTKFTLTAVASHGRLLTQPYFNPKDAPGNVAAAKVCSPLEAASWPILVTQLTLDILMYRPEACSSQAILLRAQVDCSRPISGSISPPCMHASDGNET